MISEFYGLRQAKRSGVPLINHIDEGIKILRWLGASVDTMEAFCLHPMLQSDEELNANWKDVAIEFADQGEVLMYTMEYRNVANAFLSDKVMTMITDNIRLSPVMPVNLMLIADKIQNRKDFELYHKSTHPRSTQLDVYFKMWLKRLNIDESTYQDYVQRLKEST